MVATMHRDEKIVHVGCEVYEVATPKLVEDLKGK